MSMWIRLTLILVIWLSNASLNDSINSSGKWRFCIVPGGLNLKTIRRICSKISEDHQAPVECLIVNDRINCLRRLTLGDADFAVFQPEDLVSYSSAYSESHILVSHELRFIPKRKTEFEMVAIASNKITSQMDLFGKKFCHPGINSAFSDWTPIFSNYLQTWIMPKKCELDATLLENEISSWSQYFQSACIAGPWTYDIELNSRLKARYRNLCALCDNPNGCYTGDKYHGPEGSLLCLTDDVGDVVWTKLDDAIRHFQLGGIDNSSYNYICPDGLIRPVSSSRPCIWISRPWPVIASHRDVAEKISSLMNSLNSKKFEWQMELLEIMEAHHITLVATDGLKTPEDYIRQFSGFISAISRSYCRPSRRVRWCVASNLEDRKCQWIRDTAAAYGIEPTMSCHQQPSREVSINAVQSGVCDFFIIHPQELAKAQENHLVSLLEVMPKKNEYLNKIIVLVRRNSNFFQLNDLKDTRACFVSSQSIGWNAFRAVMRHQTKDPAWDCPEKIKDFFKEIIFADSDDNDVKNHDNLNAKTYECLMSGKGDVAFVNLEEKNNSYQIEEICRRICPLEMEQSGSDSCFLTWTSLGTVMVNENMTEIRREELQTMLMQLNAWFGSRFTDENLGISLYGPYDTHEGVIFHKNAQNLQENIDHIRLPLSYKNLLKQQRNSSIKSNICNEANQKTIMHIILILTQIILVNYF